MSVAMAIGFGAKMHHNSRPSDGERSVEVDAAVDMARTRLERSGGLELELEDRSTTPVPPTPASAYTSAPTPPLRTKLRNVFLLQIGLLYGRFRLKVSIHRIRRSLRRVDSEGVEGRSHYTIARRRYHVSGPNALWHTDGNHKLNAYGFVIHGCIDGYSRYIVYLEAATNNRASTVLCIFRQGLRECGVPSRVRGDYGGENNDVARLMTELRGPDRGSFIRGTSTHNQRIERLWRDSNRLVVALFISVFQWLESLGELDPYNEVDVCALHLVYLPVINRALAEFVTAWNNHSMRTTNHRTPRELMAEFRWLGSEVNVHADDDLYQRAPAYFGIDSDDLPVFNQPHRQIEPPNKLLTDEEEAVVIGLFGNGIELDEEFGMVAYRQVRQIVRRYTLQRVG
ncbi:hypothetical protein HDU93_006579 [Gonapodya sp. JEL0774]|nr:hypothetical protein HDU93_006579 [Gonapodya sp. JEL0774]